MSAVKSEAQRNVCGRVRLLHSNFHVFLHRVHVSFAAGGSSRSALSCKLIKQAGLCDRGRWSWQCCGTCSGGWLYIWSRPSVCGEVLQLVFRLDDCLCDRNNRGKRLIIFHFLMENRVAFYVTPSKEISERKGILQPVMFPMKTSKDIAASASSLCGLPRFCRSQFCRATIRFLAIRIRVDRWDLYQRKKLISACLMQGVRILICYDSLEKHWRKVFDALYKQDVDLF